MPHPPFRQAFDLDPNLIYLNAGTHSICPRRVTDAVVRELREYERNPTAKLAYVWPKLWDSQKALGRFINARPEDLFFRPNVTSAMNAFILGMPVGEMPTGGMPTGEMPTGGMPMGGMPTGGVPKAVSRREILLSDSEYGAIANICRYRAERDGLKLRTFHLPGWSEELAELTEDQLVETIVRALKPETWLLVLSEVITGNGLVLPIERIARETRQRGVLLAVDGAHATGALPLDFSRLEDLDFYGGNLHKWVMGPKGTGFGWTHPRHHAALEPREIGWTTFQATPPHAWFAPGHSFAQRHMHAACLDFAPFLALPDAFGFWEEAGADRIRARLRELQACVDREMSSKVGWRRLCAPSRSLQGPLLAYELPPRLEAESYELMLRVLKDHRIQIASSMLQGRWVLRVSPHIHNTEAEITQAAEALATL